MPQFIVSKVLDYLFSKIPFNSKKTWIGLAVVAVSTFCELVPPETSVYQYLVGTTEFLRSLGAEDMQKTGLGVALIGLIHKLAKKRLGK